ncbi:hypothetical protein ABG768_018266 [Culter alburnus]|uniref:Uncharacterized protein n=1 Tax=Culter alburnus TaxID=194366 RepID=A0AAW1YTN9_CULAL
MNSTTARNARISAAHGMMRLATSSVTPLETEFACLDGKAIIAQNPSARQAVVRSTVIVRPPVSASVALGGKAPSATSASDTRGVCMAPATSPFSAIARKAGAACSATRI